MTANNTTIEYNVCATVRDAKTGEEISKSYGKNLLVDTGRKLIRDLIGGNGLRPETLAVGTDNTSPLSSDTALGAEVIEKPIDRRVQTSFGIEFQMLLETGDANGVDLEEAGVFEGSTMVARAVISPAITKTVAIEVTISHTFTVNAS